MKRTYRLIQQLFLLIVLPFCLHGQIPEKISYQGILTDSTGTPKPDALYTFVFRLYDTAQGGSELWRETKSLTVAGGLFATLLGDDTPFDGAIDFAKPYWLGIQVGTEPELSPRIELSSVAYSFRSIHAESSSVSSYALNAPPQSFTDSARISGTVSDGSITEAKMQDQAITHLKIADGTIRSEDISGNQVVKSVNGLRDNIILSGAGGATVTSSGDSLFITAGGGGGTGIQGVQNTDNILSIVNPAGPTTTINVRDTSIGTPQLANFSVTSSKLAFDPFSLINVSAGVLSTFNSNAGVGYQINPLARLHVLNGVINLFPSALLQEDVIIEDADAVLGLYSDAGGGFGSAISFGEIDNGALTNKWTMYRQTTEVSSNLNFSFGSEANYATNPVLLSMNPIASRIGVGTTSPLTTLHVAAAESRLRLESSASDVWTAIEYKSDGREWHTGVGGSTVINDIKNKFYVYDANAGEVRMAINESGFVGIGTTSPSDRLHVANHLRVGQDATFPAVFGEIIHDGGSNGFRINANANGGWADLHLQTDGVTRVFVESQGNVGIGTTTPTTRLDVNGHASVDVLNIRGGSDMAEPFEAENAEAVVPGTVMVLDAQHPGRVRLSSDAYDKTVVGVVSGAGGIKPGLTLRQELRMDGNVLLAIAGRVYCLAEARSTPIEPGDLLTTSDLPGYAMKAENRDRAHGSVIGKALTGLAQGATGLVLVLVSVQ